MQKKKGWFSRWRKSSAGSSPAKVSRPSSGASFASSQIKPSKAHATEVELPLQTQKEVSPNASEPNEAAARSNTDLSKHAGFDLNAMQEIIGKAKLDPGDLQVQKLSQFTVPSTPPPTHRSESASPPTTLLMKLSLDITTDPEFGTAHYEPTSQWPMSVNGSREPQIAVSTHSHHPRLVDQDLVESALYPTPQLTLPSVGDFQSAWTTEPLTKNVSEVLGSRSLGPSTDLPSLSNPDESMTPFGGWCPPPHSPFTDSASSSASLLFGSMNGSITSSPVTEGEQDPWDSRLSPMKAAGTVNLSHQGGLITTNVAGTVGPMIPQSVYFS